MLMNNCSSCGPENELLKLRCNTSRHVRECINHNCCDRLWLVDFFLFLGGGSKDKEDDLILDRKRQEVKETVVNCQLSHACVACWLLKPT